MKIMQVAFKKNSHDRKSINFEIEEDQLVGCFLAYLLKIPEREIWPKHEIHPKVFCTGASPKNAAKRILGEIGS